LASEQRVAVITGASQGIGASLVKGFRGIGYGIVANSRSIRTSEFASDEAVGSRGGVLDAAGSRRDRMATTLRSRNARHHPDDERATGSRRRSLEIDLPRRRLPEYDIVRS
jgi:NAD(P)-dependent dehydrogenase (short-subunit alcohol dehydrogenase family)